MSTQKVTTDDFLLYLLEQKPEGVVEEIDSVKAFLERIYTGESIPLSTREDKKAFEPLEK